MLLTSKLNIARLLFARTTLQDLRANSQSLLARIDISAKRRAVSILAVDNEAFHPLKTLLDAGYNVRFSLNLADVGTLRPYDVILCDLHGVATKLNPRDQGAFLIKEIKKTFPEKLVVPYTALPQNTQLARAAKIHSDDTIAKNAAIERWIDTLDALIDKSISPFEKWKRTRAALIDNEADAIEVAIVEQALIRSVLSGNRVSFESSVANLPSASNAKPILQGLISAAIWELLKPAVTGVPA